MEKEILFGGGIVDLGFDVFEVHNMFFLSLLLASHVENAVGGNSVPHIDNDNYM